MPLPKLLLSRSRQIGLLTSGPWISSLVAVGFCERSSRRIGMPGWSPLSWAYHGDDGNKYTGKGSGESYGPVYGTNDVVGCGVDFARKSAFFTKNGEKLGKY